MINARQTINDLLDMLQVLCNGLEWNIESHPTVMGECDSEALNNARRLIASVRTKLNTTETGHLCEALEYLEGARFENYSGQIVEQKDGKDHLIICDLGCACGEVGSSRSEEYAEALVTLLNNAALVPDALTLLGWAADCWEGGELRPDFDDCVEQIRSFLAGKTHGRAGGC